MFSKPLLAGSIFLSVIIAINGCASKTETLYSYPVVYALTDMPRGTAVTPNMVAEKLLPACIIPSNAAIGADSCIGHHLRENVSAGQIVGRIDIDSYHLPATREVTADAIMQSKKLRASDSTGLVVMPKSTISAGKTLKESDLEERQVSSSEILQDAMSSSASCVDREIKATLEPKQQVCQHDLRPVPASN